MDVLACNPEKVRDERFTQKASVPCRKIRCVNRLENGNPFSAFTTTEKIAVFVTAERNSSGAHRIFDGVHFTTAAGEYGKVLEGHVPVLRTVFFFENLQYGFAIDKSTPVNDFLNGGARKIHFVDVLLANPNGGCFIVVNFRRSLDLLFILRRERWLKIDELCCSFVRCEKIAFEKFVTTVDDSRGGPEICL